MADPDAAPSLARGSALPPDGNPVVDWIIHSTRRDRTVISAIPPGFARYATILIPQTDEAKSRVDAALVDVLLVHTAEQPWTLGYLDTGVADLVDAGSPRVSLYVGWPYVLVEGGPQQALISRRNSGSTPWHSALPELLFPPTAPGSCPRCGTTSGAASEDLFR